MAKVTRITEQFQHFVRELNESFWGDLYGRTRVAWKGFLDTESLRARDQWVRGSLPTGRRRAGVPQRIL